MSGIEIYDRKSTKNKLKFKNLKTSENVDRESFFYCLENRVVTMRTLLGSTGLGGRNNESIIENLRVGRVSNLGIRELFIIYIYDISYTQVLV